MGLDLFDTGMNGEYGLNLDSDVFLDWQNMNPPEGWPMLWPSECNSERESRNSGRFDGIEDA